MFLNQALKEWSVAVDALTQGKTILSLRKGGIKESGGKFTVQQDQILLFPTYEHQTPSLLKPEYQSQVTAVSPGWHPETLLLQSWAKITHGIPLTDKNALDALFPYHIWSESFIEERWQWKPQHPLLILLLRVYRLPQTVILPYSSNYGGCRSWISLNESISLENSIPVLEETAYLHLLATIFPDLLNV